MSSEDKLLFNPDLFKSSPPVYSSPPEIVSAHTRELKKSSKTITVVAIISVVFAVVSLGVIGGIIFISTTMNPDRKVFFGSILVVAIIVLIIIVCVSRHDHRSLLVFSTLLSYISAFTLGLSINYA
jgi:type IV secretory pathway component VirB8